MIRTRPPSSSWKLTLSHSWADVGGGQRQMMEEGRDPVQPAWASSKSTFIIYFVYLLLLILGT